jgi:hypothetical protein
MAGRSPWSSDSWFVVVPNLPSIGDPLRGEREVLAAPACRFIADRVEMSRESSRPHDMSPVRTVGVAHREAMSTSRGVDEHDDCRSQVEILLSRIVHEYVVAAPQRVPLEAQHHGDTNVQSVMVFGTAGSSRGSGRGVEPAKGD